MAGRSDKVLNDEVMGKVEFQEMVSLAGALLSAYILESSPSR